MQNEMNLAQIEEAIKCLDYCSEAYDTCCDNPFSITVENARAIVVPTKGCDGSSCPFETTIYIAIAGTDDVKDVRMDRRLGRTTVNSGNGSMKIHRGFMQYTELLHEAIIGRINLMVGPDWMHDSSIRIVVTGHSLGGAASVILAVKEYGLCRRQNAMYLFGCPKPGNYDLSTYIKRNFTGHIWNIQNTGDQVVTGLPWPFYTHCGHVVKIGKGWDIKPDHLLREYKRSMLSYLAERKKSCNQALIG